MLRVTTVAGDKFEVEFDETSQLTVTHPQLGTQSWGEVEKVETFTPKTAKKKGG